MNFTSELILWYKKNKRSLPWRLTTDPYKIWLSEIILQQTRIDQGMNYYLQFVEQYPNVISLAKASEQDILKLWQGLGYYSRARNLYRTAKIITTDFNGKFPEHYDELKKLPGIGEYTAAAISSIVSHEPTPVVDGNVQRFLSRIEGIKKPVDTNEGKKMILGLALNLIDHRQPGEFNQAMMEFGAIVCKPKNPDCRICLFRDRCIAYRENLVNRIPYKSKQPIQRKRFFYYLVIKSGDHSVLLYHRTGNGIWKNLYDFPMIEKDRPLSQQQILREVSDFTGIRFKKGNNMAISEEYRHILTHQLILAKFITLKLKNVTQVNKIKLKFGNTFLSVFIKDLDQFPVPKLIEKFFHDDGLIRK